MEDNNVKIIVISELLETRERKEKELQYYHEQLRELQLRMSYVQAEIHLTTKIIHMIEHEKIVDIKKHLTQKEK
jgi:cell fate regulator YaaT (PSP1 superfamily)